MKSCAKKFSQVTQFRAVVRPEFHAFFDSAYVTICGFTLLKAHYPKQKGAFIDLQRFYGADLQPPKTIEAIRNPDCGWFYRASTADFEKIPGSPIAYWMSEGMRSCYYKGTVISHEIKTAIGLNTGDNARFLRCWYEVGKEICTTSTSIGSALNSGSKWFPYNKGGSFRKWYGNKEFVIDWEDDGKEIKHYAVERNKGKHWFRYIQNLDWMFVE